MLKLLYDEIELKVLADKVLLLDTCVLIELARLPKLQDLFREVISSGCKLLITADVYDEFMRGTKSVSERQRCQELLVDLSIAVFADAEKIGTTSDGRNFQIALQGIAKEEQDMRRRILGNNVPKFKPSLVDERLLFLATATMSERPIWLCTLNFSDVPLSFFESETVICISDDGGLRSLGIYKPRIGAVKKALLEVEDDIDKLKTSVN